MNDEKSTAPHKLVDRILEDIANPVASGFFPGVQLVETALQEKYGASRVTIRTVLALLEGMGLVTNVPYRGRFVRRFSDRQITDMYRVRAVNEALAARLAAERIAPAQLKELEARLLALEKAAKRGRNPEAEKLDYEFHAFIQKVCGSDMLEEVLRRSRLLFTLIRVVHREHAGHTEKPRAAHRDIFDAIKRRDAAQAERSMWLHLAPSFA